MKYSIINNIQKITIIFSFVMASLSIFSCSNQQKELQKITESDPIITLEKQRTRGGRIPRYKVEIFKEKVVRYTGLANVSVMGTQLIELEKAEYAAILKQLELADFKALKNNYKGGMRDLPLTSISVGGQEVTYNQDNCPKQLSDLASTIENIVSEKVLK